MNQYRETGNKRCIILFIVCIIAIVFTCVHKNTVDAVEPDLQKGIAKQIIRFHVVANSDTEIDQNVKIKVKDEVVVYLQKKLKGTESKEEAKRIILKEKKNLKRIAKKTLKKEGYDYSCDVLYGKKDFPIKMYGDLTFPAGEYDALQIVLGKARGHNWWCVMFPTLCYVDGTYMVVPDASKQLLKNTLTSEEYDAISNSEHFHVEYKFKIVDWWKKFVRRAGK